MLQAECLCDELRRHGEEAEVLIEESCDAAEPGDLHAAARLEEGTVNLSSRNGAIPCSSEI